MIDRLKAKDEDAFAELIQKYNGQLQKLALMFVSNPATAEEVVQETWLAVLKGINNFEGRSSLKTWIFRILVNRARTRGKRDQRTVLLDEHGQRGRNALDTLMEQRGQDTGSWFNVSRSPEDGTPEALLRRKQARHDIAKAMHKLPPRQRDVVMLRDLIGMRYDDACSILGVSESNQRVLLHRGRARLRDSLEHLASGV